MFRPFLILLTLLFVVDFAYAKDDKKHNILSDIIINSDNLILDKATSTSVFSGHVVLWFNNGIIIETDKVILTIKEKDDKKALTSILLPNKLRAIKDGASPLKTIGKNKTGHSEITIIADSAGYIEDKSELVLRGNVYMQEDSSFVQCEELFYLAKIEKLSTNGK